MSLRSLDRYLAHVAEVARRGSVKLTVHQMKYGYAPAYDIGPDGEVRILECSLPMGTRPPRPPPAGEDMIEVAIRAAEEGR